MIQYFIYQEKTKLNKKGVVKLGKGFKRIIGFLIFIILLGVRTNSVLATTVEYGIKMKIDNVYFVPKEENGEDIRPLLHENRVYLPIRALSEAMGLKVDFVDGNVYMESGYVKKIDDNKRNYFNKSDMVNVTMSKDIKAYVDNTYIDQEVLKYKNRTYFPVRVLGDALNVKIDYHNELRVVLIGDSVIEDMDYILTKEPITQEAIKNKLNQLRSKFPHGKYWNSNGLDPDVDSSDKVTNNPCKHRGPVEGWSYFGSEGDHCKGYTGVTASGSQCYGFASKISDEIFGEDPVVNVHDDFDKAKIGDNIRVNGHSMIIIEKSKDYVKVVECNYGDTCIIKWDRKVYRKSLNGAEYTTRY